MAMLLLPKANCLNFKFHVGPITGQPEWRQHISKDPWKQKMDKLMFLSFVSFPVTLDFNWKIVTLVFQGL